MVTLKQLCEETGVSRRAVQGYEEKKLISPGGKDRMGHLLYEEVEVEKVKKIRLFQDPGMTLKEIKMLEEMGKDEEKEFLNNRLTDMKEKEERLRKRMDELELYIRRI